MLQIRLMDHSRLLPSLLTEGSFSPRTMVVELPDYNSTELFRSLAESRYPTVRRILVHELNHWYDLVGSVWGQKYIDLLFRAYDQLNYHLPHLKDASYRPTLELFDFERQSLFPSYFKFSSAPVGTNRDFDPSTFIISTGNNFSPMGERRDDNPLFFASAQNHLGHRFRQPLTAGTLLEMRARSAEIEDFLAWLHTLPHDEAVAEIHLFSQALENGLLDGSMLTYTGAFHLLRSRFPNVNNFDLWQLGALIADVSLNLPPSAFRRIQVDNYFPTMPPARAHGFVEGENVGIVLPCIVEFLSGILNQLTKNSLDLAILKLTSVDKSEIYEAANSFISSTGREAIGTLELSRIREKLRLAGQKVLSIKAAYGGRISLQQMSELPSPRIMTGDLEVCTFGPGVLSDEEYDVIENYHFRLNDNIRDALRAARGLDFSFSDYSY